VLSVLFLVTGSIWAPLAAHYLLNILQIVFANRSGYRPLRS
jgi:membrane protease YdiL (CAAX protease family)